MQMQRTKFGNPHKGHRASKKSAYYQNFRLKYSGKLIRRKAKRQKGIAAAKLKVRKEHPADLRRRERRISLQWTD